MLRIAIDANPIVEVRGGVGYYTQSIVESLIKLGCHVYLLAMNSSKNLTRFDKFENVEIVTGFSWLKSEAIWSQVALPLLLKKTEAQYYWGTGQSIPLITLRPIKNIITIHDFAYLICPETMSLGRRYYLKLFSRAMIKKSDFVFCVSNATANKLANFYSRRADAIIEPPLRYKSFYPQKKINLPAPKYYLYVGSMEPRKNIDIIVRAFVKSNPSSTSLVIVGGVGWNNSNIKDVISEAKKKLGDKILIWKFSDDDTLYHFYKNAKATILVSSYEGYGMPLAESRVIGTPVIASDMEEHREASENTGFFFKKENLEFDLCDFFREHDLDDSLGDAGSCSYREENEKIKNALDVLINENN